MAESTVDATQIKSQQREVWNASAEGWNRHWSRMERAGQAIADRLVDLAGVKPGDHVLDVATGIGEPAITVARRVGPSGRVIATDQSPGMLKFGRERATALGLRNMEFIEADAEALDFAERSFDAVTCRWGLMFLPNLAAALARINRMLKPGARFATSVWAAAPKVPMITLGGDALRRIANLPPPPPGSPDPLNLADIARLERMMAEAGFSDLRHEPVIVSFDFASVDDFIDFRLGLSAMYRSTWEKLSPEQRDQVRAATATEMEPYRNAKGEFTLGNESICVVGRRAS